MTKQPTQKRIAVFTGAGVSAESGLSTFRDADGYWAKYRIEDVCTAQAIVRNRDLVIRFYNERRREAMAALPNAAHKAIAALEESFLTDVITQNVDDLHERAGSTRVTHLHGEIMKLRSSDDENALVACEGWEQPLDARHTDGSLLRPHIVFFGEAVPMFAHAASLVSAADIVLVVGTSLNVYPAASLLEYADEEAPIFVVDPGMPEFGIFRDRVTHIRKRASEGVPEVCDLLRSRYGV